MNVLIHSTIAATALVATAAIAFASVLLYSDADIHVSAKADRLPIAESVAGNTEFMTIESRGEHLSVLQRIPVTTLASN